MTEQPLMVVGVGMPAMIYLNEFGSQLWHAFDQPAYHVGSSLISKTWRDVDVRLMLPDYQYEAMGLGDPKQTHLCGKWIALCLAFSALGQRITGLPIDFQIQQQTLANTLYGSKYPRSALGIVPLRIKDA